MSKVTASEQRRNAHQMLLMAMRGTSGLGRPDVEMDDKGALVLSFKGWSPALARIRVATPGFFGPSQADPVTPYLDEVMATQASRAREAHDRYGRHTPFEPGEPDHLATILIDDALRHLLGQDRLMETAAKVLRDLHNQTGAAARKYTGGSHLLSTGGHLIEVPCGRDAHCDRVLGMTTRLHRDDLDAAMWFDGAGVSIPRRGLPEGLAAAASGKMLREVVEMPAHLNGTGISDRRIISVETKCDKDGRPMMLRFTLKPSLHLVCDAITP